MSDETRDRRAEAAEDFHRRAVADYDALPPATIHSTTGVCTLAPDRPHADVGLCRACIEQGLFDALVNCTQAKS